MDESCIDAGDTSWVMVAFVLVLSMFPGLAFFEAGLLRSKNTLSILVQIFSGIALNAALWDIIGFSLVYFGNFDHAFLMNTPYDDCLQNYAPKIPAAAFAMFTMLFAVITPLLMTGAYAERLKFKACFLITFLWELFIYYPVAYLIWGPGFLNELGVLDFAGGIVIHTSSGAGALISAIVLGKRRHFHEYQGDFPPSNLPLAALVFWCNFHKCSGIHTNWLCIFSIGLACLQFLVQ
jgi:Amt family ammonium transporter